MAQKTNYTEFVHDLVRQAEEPLKLEEILAVLEEDEEFDSKNPRSTLRSIIRASGLIKPVGKSRYGWLPTLSQGSRLRHLLASDDFDSRKLRWDHDLAVALWPALDEPEKRRDEGPVTLQLGGQTKVEVRPERDGKTLTSEPGPEFWGWLSENRAEPGDYLIVTVEEPSERLFLVQHQARAKRNPELISERDRAAKRKIKKFLGTKRGKVAPPAEIAGALLAESFYQDSTAPSGLTNLLSEELLKKYGQAVVLDTDEVVQSSNVIPFPKRNQESDDSTAPRGEGSLEMHPSFELSVPSHTGLELPDSAAYQRALTSLAESPEVTPALALHTLEISRLCSPGYALLSQTSEYESEALELAGQAVVAAERRLAHIIIESVISGSEVNVEDPMDHYLEARSFLARALWMAQQDDAAVEQALHCFELAPDDQGIREDLFVMLLDTDRGELVLDLLAKFPSESGTENAYHPALVKLLEDPEGKEALRFLRKALKQNPYLGRLLLGEDPKKGKKSQIDEAHDYEAAYGFLWRREDVIFDKLEEAVLARR